MIPLLFVFLWMNNAFALDIVGEDEPVFVTAFLQLPDRVLIDTELSVSGELQKETVERQVSWSVSGPPGVHTVWFESSDGERVSHEVIIGDRPEDPIVVHSGVFVRTEVGYQKATPFGDVSFFGYNPGWLFTYILFSIVFSIGLRKLLRIH